MEGKHPGGRPVGSKNKIKFKDHMSAKDIKTLVENAKKRAETDSSVLKFLMEQVFGKAAQPISNDSNEPFKLQIIRAGEDKKK
jgi:hypothetical protein